MNVTPAAIAAAKRVERIGDATLLLGDCLDILPHLGPVDAVVTDPPYGIGADKGQASRANRRDGAALLPSRDYGESDWDDAPATTEQISMILSQSRWQIIFGGNYFALPPSRCWLVWDKQNGENDYADCELAWTNLDKPVRRVLWLWHGMMRKGNEERVHPTQKPLGVMLWCINHLPHSTITVCDPFVFSGTTGVACVKAGKQFIGIEREPRYFDIACRRIADAYKQPDFFVERPAPAVQEQMFPKEAAE